MKRAALPRPWLLLALASLAGCPEERPGAERQIPRERIPPAVAVEPAPVDGGVLPRAPEPPDGGASRRP